jgi:predicted O-methyltransferase YrrM
MSYHGYIPFISNYASNIKKSKGSVKILEIGLLTGVSLFSIINNLNGLGIEGYEYTGVDIKLNEEIKIFNLYTYKTKDSKINLLEENSIEFLKNCEEEFDIILIDGDHNYPTVKKECEFLTKISNKNTLFVFDDYFGKWSKSDLFYKEREGWENVDNFSELIPDSVKKGVKPAVDEFLEREYLKSFTLMSGEPICLIYNNNDVIRLNND